MSRPAALLHPPLALIVALALAVALTALCLGQARAQGVGTIALTVSEGETIRLSEPAQTIFVADPQIADVQVAAPDVIFIFGKTPGRTTLFALDGAGRRIVASPVAVMRPLSFLRELLRDEVGDFGVVVETTDTGLILTGTVPTAGDAQKAKEIAAQFAGNGALVTNRLTVAGPLQVKLRVRIAEVSRNLSHELGFDWSAFGTAGDFAFGLATGRPFPAGAGRVVRAGGGVGSALAGIRGGDVDVSAVLDALAQDGLVTILAEPSLTAMSGETARFLAGGEFPIPIIGEDSIPSVEFRRFGVSLEFQPTVISADRIMVRVAPEVSELTNQGAITLDDLSIPAISIRQAETSVELASGQTFAIAGLMQNTSDTIVRKFPGLGDLPVIGRLFTSSAFQREETELIILVTPYVVRPTPGEAFAKAPTDYLVPATHLERILFGKLSRGRGERPPHLIGQAGFMVE